MITLHIEHAITDLATWSEAFSRFEQARHDAGVTAQHVRQPVDDDRYIVVDLDFDDVDAAMEFKAFLESVVWQSRDLSPGLSAAPSARVLQEVDLTT